MTSGPAVVLKVLDLFVFEGSAAASHSPDVPGSLIETGTGATAVEDVITNTRATVHDEDMSTWVRKLAACELPIC